MIRLNPLAGEDYDNLKQSLDTIESSHGVCMNRLYYLSIPPAVYSTAVHNLGKHDLNGSCKHGNATTRLLVEKPFGYDLETAKELIASTEKYFKEEQIFRIDHYLAKESAQNILTFRRHNPVFTDSWDGTHVSKISVVAHEKIGIEGRGSFYDDVGALRDLVQSHLLQLLALVMLDTDGTDEDTALHSAKQALLASLRPVEVEKTIRGQYEGYKDEASNPTSTTETFVHLQLESTLPKWRNTRISIETGKALSDKKTEIEMVFTDSTKSTNELKFRIHPNEGIYLTLTAKKPDFEHRTQRVSMDFSYNGAFDEPLHPDAYERVLVDAVRGDHSLFATSSEVIASWQALQPILSYWSKSDNISIYKVGSDGPV